MPLRALNKTNPVYGADSIDTSGSDHVTNLERPFYQGCIFAELENIGMEPAGEMRTELGFAKGDMNIGGSLPCCKLAVNELREPGLAEKNHGLLPRTIEVDIERSQNRGTTRRNKKEDEIWVFLAKPRHNFR